MTRVRVGGGRGCGGGRCGGGILIRAAVVVVRQVLERVGVEVRVEKRGRHGLAVPGSGRRVVRGGVGIGRPRVGHSLVQVFAILVVARLLLLHSVLVDGWRPIRGRGLEVGEQSMT